ncbi:MAG: YggS family pyridoxal phosphate-dependent enzyme [Oscillospiraceae bacterium]|jgi:pyridoxal phosphate enzyme (YggS family)|nr:YggS family pyridoxal phosphate-dependent enzyme [Oscillospiraceae bacterium]
MPCNEAFSERCAQVRAQYARVLEQVQTAAIRAGRHEDDVRLMAVSKTVDEPLMLAAMEAGATLFGENKVQELVRKRPQFPAETCEIHLIGHLQSNKATKAVETADLIQSVDSLKLAKELSRVCAIKHCAIDVLLEVNIGRDAAKFGFMPEELPEAAAEISQLEGIVTRGLMCVPPFCVNSSQTAKFFLNMYHLFLDNSTKKMDNRCMGTLPWDILSMGMSGDYEAAVAEGATIVRVGTAIFGSRV